MRVFLDKCASIDIKVLQLKYRIPASATHFERTTAGQHTLDWVGYADNLDFLFEDITNLEETFDVLSTTFKTYHLEINISKTKKMIFNNQYIDGEYPETIVNINNMSVENTTTFKYLGCNIKYVEPSTGDSQLEMRMDTAQYKFYELRKK